MPSALALRLGSDVHCSDGKAGSLHRLIVDLGMNVTTSLDVAGHLGSGHLVALGLVVSAGTQIQLELTLEAFGGLPGDEVRQVTLGGPSPLQPPDLLGRSMFGGGGGARGPAGEMYSMNSAPPEGTIAISGHEPVFASDGHIGRVAGLVVDRDSGRYSHLLLGEGHLFGEHEIAIPTDGIIGIGPEGAALSITKAQVNALPTFAP